MLVHVESAGDTRVPIATLIGADFSALSITPSRADQAPGAVRAAFPRFAPYDAAHDTDLSTRSIIDLGDAGAVRLAWREAFEAIEATTIRALDQDRFTIVLGGDHSITRPVVEAVAQRASRLGIVQLDVHHDVRPLDDGPSNGTPIRGLIDSGTVLAGDVCQIGIHPFANRREFGVWCELHGVKQWSLDEVSRDGARRVAVGSLGALHACDQIHLTVDIDVLDRAFAPGTVAALPGGLMPDQLVELVSVICADSRVRSMDVVEFDPSRDVQSVTAYNVVHVVMSAVSAVARRPDAR